MFAAQRLENIKKIMLQQENVNIVTLCNLLNVSDATIRRDLEKLENEGFLFKTHGGAILSKQGEERKDISQIPRYVEKDNIASQCVKLVEEADNIFIGAGATCFMLSQKLKNFPGITVVTNSIGVADELQDHVKKVYLLGGEIYTVSETKYTLNPYDDDDFKHVFLDKVIISADGVDLQVGLTSDNLRLSNLYKQAIQKANYTITLMDNSKFGRISLYAICPLAEIDCIITEPNLPDQYNEFFFSNNIQFVTASPL